MKTTTQLLCAVLPILVAGTMDKKYQSTFLFAGAAILIVVALNNLGE